MKKFIKKIIIIFEIIFLIPIILSSLLLKIIRKGGVHNFLLSKKIFNVIGVFPIINHYYEPLFQKKQLNKPLSSKRSIPAVDFNIDKQLKIIKNFNFIDEFKSFINKEDNKFYFGNGSFESGDAEYLYNFIRYFKPKKIIEIGSGFSSLIIQESLRVNFHEDKSILPEQICIEPYEVPWLEKTGIKVIRKEVEMIDMAFFDSLSTGDLLFIDSSHIIRPQGDVIYEYLELLPKLNNGVFVHIHDIFSPKDYPTEWVIDQVKFWNEQYLLEAFLSNNDSWEVIASLNLLHNEYFNDLKKVCPYLNSNRDPGSFYIRKIK